MLHIAQLVEFLHTWELAAGRAHVGRAFSGYAARPTRRSPGRTRDRMLPRRY